MPAHSWRWLKVDWMVRMVSVMVMLVTIEAAIGIHRAVIVAWLLVVVRLGMCWLVLIVAGLVESLRIPPVAFRLLQ